MVRTTKSSKEVPPPTPGSLRLQLGRSAIVRAAADVFARLGAEATRVEDLLDAADVARRTFYKHFRSKEEVLAAVYELVSHELLSAMATRGAAADDPTAALRATLDVYLGFHVDNGRIVRVLVEEGMRSGSPVAPMRRRLRDALAARLDDTFRAVSGRAVDPYVFYALLAGIEGISLELVARDRAPTPDEIARARAALHGLLDASLRGAELLPTRPGG